MSWGSLERSAIVVVLNSCTKLQQMTGGAKAHRGVFLDRGVFPIRGYCVGGPVQPATTCALIPSSRSPRTPEYTHGGRPGKSGFGAHLSVFFLGLWPPNSSVFWNGLLGPPGFIRFLVTACKNGNKIGKNPDFLLGSAQAVRTAPAIERSC